MLDFEIFVATNRMILMVLCVDVRSDLDPSFIDTSVFVDVYVYVFVSC